MKPRLARSVLCLSMFLLSCTQVEFKARVWPSTPTRPVFPELQSLENPCLSPAVYADLKHLAQRDVGVAFSGGGARAAAAALGQLRALHAIRVGSQGKQWNTEKALTDASPPRWIDRVRYISSVSGGAWTSTAFTFLPHQFDDSEFLGCVKSPRDFAWDELDEPNGLMEAAIGRGSRFEHLFGRYLRRAGTEAWGRAIADTFLADFHLNQQRAWFAAGPETRNELKTTLHWWRMSDRFAAIPKPGRPFLITSATILANSKLTENGDADLYPMEITPLYAGSVGFGNPAGGAAHQFGGGFIETFAMDADELTWDPKGESAEGVISDVGQRFTLSDMMGATSSAAVETIARKLPLVNSNDLGFARYRVPPIGSTTSHADRRYAMGDGAHLDNLGVLPLLARGVKHILVFVNTPDPMTLPKKEDTEWWRGSDPAVTSNPKLGNNDPTVRLAKNYIWKHQAPFLDDLRALFNFHSKKRKVVVFSQEAFIKLYREFHDLKQANKPLVVCSSMQVKENSHFGVKASTSAEDQPTICWVYLDRYPDFIAQLNQSRLCVEHKHALSFGAAPTPGFPHFATTFGDGPQIVDLDTASIAGLAHLTAWTLHDSAGTIDKALFGPRSYPAPSTDCKLPPTAGAP